MNNLLVYWDFAFGSIFKNKKQQSFNYNLIFRNKIIEFAYIGTGYLQLLENIIYITFVNYNKKEYIFLCWPDF